METIKKNIIVRPLVGTLLLLLIPLVLQLTIGSGVDGQGFNWKPGDFVVIGILLFITGLLIEVVLRRAGKYRILAVAVIVIGFLLLWAELAVGVFTNLGS